MFGLTALTMLVGLLIQIVVAVNADEGYFDGAAARIFNVFCYFTVQSNVIVGVTCLLLAIDPHRRSTVFKVFRLVGLVDIAITGVVYHVALADLQELTGEALIADQLLHTVVPIMAVVGWVMFGPREQISWPIIGWAALIPAAWVVFTLIRGPIVDFYPYPFIDVDLHGYAVVMRNIALVGVVFGAFAALAKWLDGALHERLWSVSAA
jgi:hypothetical protein